MASPLARPAHPHPRAFTGACSSHRADHALSAQDQCEQERRVGASRGAILTLPSSRCHPHAAILKLPSSRCLPQVAVLSLVALPSSRRLLCDAVFFTMPPSRCSPHDAALTMCPRDAALTMPPSRARCRPPMPSADAVKAVYSSACQHVCVPAHVHASASARPHASASACSLARQRVRSCCSCTVAVPTRA